MGNIPTQPSHGILGRTKGTVGGTALQPAERWVKGVVLTEGLHKAV